MSFLVYDDSKKCAEAWISMYDFHNLDYGDDELNDFAKTLNADKFMHYRFWPEVKYTNETEILIWGNKNRFKIVQYYPRNSNDVVWFLRDVNNKSKPTLVRKNISYEEYAKYLFSVYTPERMAKRLAPVIKEEMPKILDIRAKAKRAEYLNNPQLWTTDEKIDEWLKNLIYVKRIYPEYIYEDDFRYFKKGMNAQKRVYEIEKTFDDREWIIAKRKYKKEFGEDYYK